MWNGFWLDQLHLVLVTSICIVVAAFLIGSGDSESAKVWLTVGFDVWSDVMNLFFHGKPLKPIRW